MNLFKVYSALVILLVLCTYDAEGGIILLLLLKIIALKGALFFGMPLAIGSFMMGQGMGFFGGSLFGGYSMLNAAHKYHKNQAAKFKGHKLKPISHHVAYEPSHGWGWEAPQPEVDYGHHIHHNDHYHHYNHQRFHAAKPSLLSKISRIPSAIVDRFRSKRPHLSVKIPPVVSYKSPTYGEYGAGTSQHGSDNYHQGYGHNDPMNTYYETSDTSDKYTGLLSDKDHPSESSRDVDWNQGLANLMKAAELANTLPSHSHQDEPHSIGGYSSGYEQPSGGYQSSSGYEESSPPKYESLTGGYGEGMDAVHPPSDTAHSEYSSYGAPAQEPSPQYGYNSPHAQSEPAQSYSPYDGEGQESEESFKKVRAPNSIIEKYLEKKLKDEMDKQKSDAQRKEAAQLITMLRQVYIKELVDSLGPQDRQARTVQKGSTTELPGFIPFPVDVPNSTTAKPKSVIQLSTLSPSTSTSTTTPASSTTTSAPMTSRQVNPLTLTRQSAEPTRFVRMKTSFVLNKRQMMERERRNPVRSRRQNSPMDIQALTAFTDDIKKFFLLVSILDQDKCLQKLVCDVHTRADKDNLTPYETNIVITFKVMNAMIQMDTEDSTINYRKASKIGELSKSAQVCNKAYPTCTYTPSEIIGMGNLVAQTGSVDSVTSKPQVVSTDQDTAGSEVISEQIQPFIQFPTVMPRV